MAKKVNDGSKPGEYEAKKARWRCGMCETKFPEPDNHLCPSCDSDEIELMIYVREVM